MDLRLYWQSLSHPSQAVRAMLEHKHLEYRLIDVLPLNQRVHLRLAGFRGGTVPALKVDGRRVQGSRQIARVVDELSTKSALFPVDPELRAEVEHAERWGEQMLQPIPRRLARFGSAHHLAVRRAGATAGGVPLAALVALTSAPLAAYYARAAEPDGRRGNEAGIRADLAALPSLLGEADRLLTEGVLKSEPPNAATFQILATVRMLDAFADLHPHIGSRPSVARARELFADYPAVFPSFLPSGWLEPLAQDH